MNVSLPLMDCMDRCVSSHCVGFEHHVDGSCVHFFRGSYSVTYESQQHTVDFVANGAESGDSHHLHSYLDIPHCASCRDGLCSCAGFGHCKSSSTRLFPFANALSKNSSFEDCAAVCTATSSCIGFEVLPHVIDVNVLHYARCYLYFATTPSTDLVFVHKARLLTVPSAARVIDSTEPIVSQCYACGIPRYRSLTDTQIQAAMARAPPLPDPSTPFDPALRMYGKRFSLADQGVASAIVFDALTAQRILLQISGAVVPPSPISMGLSESGTIVRTSSCDSFSQYSPMAPTCSDLRTCSAEVSRYDYPTMWWYGDRHVEVPDRASSGWLSFQSSEFSMTGCNSELHGLFYSSKSLLRSIVAVVNVSSRLSDAAEKSSDFALLNGAPSFIWKPNENESTRWVSCTVKDMASYDIIVGDAVGLLVECGSASTILDLHKSCEATPLCDGYTSVIERLPSGETVERPRCLVRGSPFQAASVEPEALWIGTLRLFYRKPRFNESSCTFISPKSGPIAIHIAQTSFLYGAVEVYVADERVALCGGEYPFQRNVRGTAGDCATYFDCYRGTVAANVTIRVVPIRKLSRGSCSGALTSLLEVDALNPVGPGFPNSTQAATNSFTHSRDVWLNYRNSNNRRAVVYVANITAFAVSVAQTNMRCDATSMCGQNQIVVRSTLKPFNGAAVTDNVKCGGRSGFSGNASGDSFQCLVYLFCDTVSFPQPVSGLIEISADGSIFSTPRNISCFPFTSRLHVRYSGYETPFPTQVSGFGDYRSFDLLEGEHPAGLIVLRHPLLSSKLVVSLTAPTAESRNRVCVIDHIPQGQAYCVASISNGMYNFVSVKVAQSDFALTQLTVSFRSAGLDRVGGTTTCGGESFSTFTGEVGRSNDCNTSLTCFSSFIPPGAAEVVLSTTAGLECQSCAASLIALITFSNVTVAHPACSSEYVCFNPLHSDSPCLTFPDFCNDVADCGSYTDEDLCSHWILFSQFSVLPLENTISTVEGVTILADCRRHAVILRSEGFAFSVSAKRCIVYNESFLMSEFVQSPTRYLITSPLYHFYMRIVSRSIVEQCLDQVHCSGHGRVLDYSTCSCACNSGWLGIHCNTQYQFGDIRGLVLVLNSTSAYALPPIDTVTLSSILESLALSYLRSATTVQVTFRSLEPMVSNIVGLPFSVELTRNSEDSVDEYYASSVLVVSEVQRLRTWLLSRSALHALRSLLSTSNLSFPCVQYIVPQWSLIEPLPITSFCDVVGDDAIHCDGFAPISALRKIILRFYEMPTSTRVTVSLSVRDADSRRRTVSSTADCANSTVRTTFRDGCVVATCAIDPKAVLISNATELSKILVSFAKSASEEETVSSASCATGFDVFAMNEVILPLEPIPTTAALNYRLDKGKMIALCVIGAVALCTWGFTAYLLMLRKQQRHNDEQIMLDVQTDTSADDIELSVASESVRSVSPHEGQRNLPLPTSVVEPVSCEVDVATPNDVDVEMPNDVDFEVACDDEHESVFEIANEPNQPLPTDLVASFECERYEAPGTRPIPTPTEHLSYVALEGARMALGNVDMDTANESAFGHAKMKVLSLRRFVYLFVSLSALCGVGAAYCLVIYVVLLFGGEYNVMIEHFYDEECSNSNYTFQPYRVSSSPADGDCHTMETVGSVTAATYCVAARCRRGWDLSLNVELSLGHTRAACRRARKQYRDAVCLRSADVFDENNIGGIVVRCVSPQAARKRLRAFETIVEIPNATEQVAPTGAAASLTARRTDGSLHWSTYQTGKIVETQSSFYSERYIAYSNATLGLQVPEGWDVVNQTSGYWLPAAAVAVLARTSSVTPSMMLSTRDAPVGRLFNGFHQGVPPQNDWALAPSSGSVRFFGIERTLADIGQSLINDQAASISLWVRATRETVGFPFVLCDGLASSLMTAPLLERAAASLMSGNPPSLWFKADWHVYMGLFVDGNNEAIHFFHADPSSEQPDAPVESFVWDSVGSAFLVSSLFNGQWHHVSLDISKAKGQTHRLLIRLFVDAQTQYFGTSHVACGSANRLLTGIRSLSKANVFDSLKDYYVNGGVLHVGYFVGAVHALAFSRHGVRSTVQLARSTTTVNLDSFKTAINVATIAGSALIALSLTVLVVEVVLYWRSRCTACNACSPVRVHAEALYSSLCSCPWVDDDGERFETPSFAVAQKLLRFSEAEFLGFLFEVEVACEECSAELSHGMYLSMALERLNEAQPSAKAWNAAVHKCTEGLEGAETQDSGSAHKPCLVVSHDATVGCLLWYFIVPTLLAIQKVACYTESMSPSIPESFETRAGPPLGVATLELVMITNAASPLISFVARNILLIVLFHVGVAALFRSELRFFRRVQQHASSASNPLALGGPHGAPHVILPIQLCRALESYLRTAPLQSYAVFPGASYALYFVNEFVATIKDERRVLRAFAQTNLGLRTFALQRVGHCPFHRQPLDLCFVDSQDHVYCAVAECTSHTQDEIGHLSYSCRVHGCHFALCPRHFHQHCNPQCASCSTSTFSAVFLSITALLLVPCTHDAVGWLRCHPAVACASCGCYFIVSNLANVTIAFAACAILSYALLVVVVPSAVVRRRLQHLRRVPESTQFADHSKLHFVGCLLRESRWWLWSGFLLLSLIEVAAIRLIDPFSVWQGITVSIVECAAGAAVSTVRPFACPLVSLHWGLITGHQLAFLGLMSIQFAQLPSVASNVVAVAMVVELVCFVAFSCAIMFSFYFGRRKTSLGHVHQLLSAQKGQCTIPLFAAPQWIFS